MPTSDPAAELEATIARVARDFAGDQTIRPSFEASPKPEMGDYSSNAAMLMAKSLGRPPRDIAAELATKTDARVGAGARLGEGLDGLGDGTGADVAEARKHRVTPSSRARKGARRASAA